MQRDLSRQEIERLFRVVEWNPSSAQISAINAALRHSLSLGKSLSIGDCQGIVSDACPDAIFIVTEGVDNSDLNTLLALATKVK